MIRTLVLIVGSLLSIQGIAQNVPGAEKVLRNFMEAKSSNDFERVKSYVPNIEKEEFEYFSKPESYEVLRILKVGVDLKIVPTYEAGDIVFEVRELTPNELIYYQLRFKNGAWHIEGFEVDAAFWHRPF